MSDIDVANLATHDRPPQVQYLPRHATPGVARMRGMAPKDPAACRRSATVLTLLVNRRMVRIMFSRRSGARSLLVLAALATAVTCTKAAPARAPTPAPNSTREPIQQLPRALTANEHALIARSNAFAFSLFHQVASQQPDSNIFMSPFSASMALEMAATGARGKTLAALRSTLGVKSIADANSSYESLLALLRTLDPRVTFSIANALWYRDGLPVEDAFLEANTRFFGATVHALDFDDPAAARTMNRWVSDATQGKIQQLVDGPIDTSTVLFLTDAIYFKGRWQNEYDTAATHPAPFHLEDGSSVSVAMMDGDGAMRVASAPTYEAAELAYGDDAFVMDIVLPNAGTPVGGVTTALAHGGWPSLLATLQDKGGEVQMPRFHLAWSASLRPPLTALGMGSAFGRDADFSGIATGGHLKLSEVRHEAVVDVDEDGTTAAAATSIAVFGPTTIAPHFVFRADRPFLFVIRDRLTGLILFVGQLTRPASA
jgi:serine protease inhibitor